jgi:hypothetical protein
MLEEVSKNGEKLCPFLKNVATFLQNIGKK